MIVLGIDFTLAEDSATQLLGAIGQNSDSAGTLKYKYVQYDTGAGAVAAAVGQVAYYYLASGYNDNKVTSDLSDSVNVGAGVLGSAPTDGQFCWIQIGGPATLSIALAAGADGNALTAVGATDGTLDVSAAVTDHVCAIATDISAQEIVCSFPE